MKSFRACFVLLGVLSIIAANLACSESRDQEEVQMDPVIVEVEVEPSTVAVSDEATEDSQKKVKAAALVQETAAQDRPDEFQISTYEVAPREEGLEKEELLKEQPGAAVIPHVEPDQEVSAIPAVTEKKPASRDSEFNPELDGQSAVPAVVNPEKVVVPSPPRRLDHVPKVKPDEAGRADNEVTPAKTQIPEGTVLAVRVAESISTESNGPGDLFRVLLDDAVVIDGREVLPKGTELEGRIVEALEPGRVKGRARLTFELSAILLDDEAVAIRTNPITIEAENSKGRDARAVGAVTAIGSVLGAVFGGKKGAVIGAAAGAGAGTAGVVLTKGEQVELEKERYFSFRLEETIYLGTR